MPYKSAKQSRYLHAKKPKVAAKFDAEERKAKSKRKRRTKKGKTK